MCAHSNKPLISEASSFPRSERSSPAGNSNNVKNAIPDPKAILKKPGVRITGAGIGGLTTVLCEKAGIEYFVIDSATKVNPLSKSPAMMKVKITTFQFVTVTCKFSRLCTFLQSQHASNIRSTWSDRLNQRVLVSD